MSCFGGDGSGELSQVEVAADFFHESRLGREVVFGYGIKFQSSFELIIQSGLGEYAFCSLVGNEFQHPSFNSGLNLLAPNGDGGSRFLAFAIYLVLDFSLYRGFFRPKIKGTYQLTATSGGEFRSESVFSISCNYYKGFHGFILFGDDLIIKDNGYVKASFDFIIQDFSREKCYTAKKCGFMCFSWMQRVIQMRRVTSEEKL
ncbi:hypothetical protein V6N12_051907 [Hibiscus sabdariffa]|uniref:Uncharacterized protein n=1 Tax=Hibiscus sabdariffa TaxID=183260 RepID=A0ABR2GIG9_9ROSI